MAPILTQLDEHIADYGKMMEHLFSHQTPHTAQYADTVDKLRELGKQMIEQTERLVDFERDQIQANLLLLKKQVVAWSALAVILTTFLPPSIILRIFKHFSIIKKATKDIALGRYRYRSIEVITTQMMK